MKFTWSGNPSESEEGDPAWFTIADIPFKTMWPDDLYWLPHVIAGKKIKAAFVFGEGDIILDKKIEIVESV